MPIHLYPLLQYLYAVLLDGDVHNDWLGHIYITTREHWFHIGRLLALVLLKG